MKRKAEIATVTIVLTNGLHLQMHPKTQECWSWFVSPNGYVSHYEHGTIEQLIKVLEERKGNQ